VLSEPALTSVAGGDIADEKIPLNDARRLI
jgi:hypothetical protein